MANDLEQWLRGLDLAKYVAAFTENEVGLQDLPHLTDDDLKALGLPLGPRQRSLSQLRSRRPMSPLRDHRPSAGN